MFKRTKGYFLLTMLVLTGLAGRLHSDTLTAKERRYLVSELKTSKAAFLRTVDGLSNRQLNFKPGEGRMSIKDCIYKLASIENDLWSRAKTSLKQQAISSQKTVLDDDVLNDVVQQQPAPASKEVKFRTTKDALRFYKSQQMQMLRYAHTSTENVRAHIAETGLGDFDAYQLILLTTIYTDHYMKQIEQIKSNPRFPK